MQFEKIRTINKSKIIVGGVISLGVISALIYFPSRAKYRTTQEFNIVNGTINYRVPDLNVVAMYSSEDGNNYTEITGRMPNSGYVINESKSYCNLNGSKDTSVRLYTNSEKEHVISNLTKGDKCYLYFDKDKITVEDILDNLGIGNPKEPTSNMFASVATTDEGVFKADDPIYGGTSYYYRGAVTNNYVKFVGFCWRIIRINGDGSIRMIYDGTTCHTNGASTAESIAVASQAYNSSHNKSYYVGYTWEAKQRPANNATASASNLKTKTDSWYKANISDKGYDDKVAEGKFCNDRNTASGYTWSATSSSEFYYAPRGRLQINKAPSLTCDTGDVYTLKAGAITADEVSFAGGVYGTGNSKYYLYNGQYYWTMSPSYWMNSSNYALVLAVWNDGQLGDIHVSSDVQLGDARGVRPVINLRADTVFSSGDGTIDSPFTVQ